MKIEMGESLIYSWLTHEKSCQIVDTNWKTSKKWNLMNVAKIQEVIDATYAIFTTNGKAPKLETFLKCGECDLLGINFHNTIQGKYTLHAVDIAFHEGGLGYNEYDKTAGKHKNVSAARAIKKSLRTALSIFGYLNITSGYIYFISPKISPKVYADLNVRLSTLQSIMDSLGFDFKFIVYANEDFTNTVLNPIIEISDLIKNDNELWVRSYQLLALAEKFKNLKITDIITKGLPVAKLPKKKSSKTPVATAPGASAGISIANYAKQIIDVINAGKVTAAEIKDFEDKATSKQLFDINFPLLVNVKNIYDPKRYYKQKNLSVKYGGEEYVFCSQWFARQKPFLDKWFKKH